MLSVNQKYYSQALDSYFPKIPYFNLITFLVLEFLNDLSKSKDDFGKSVKKVYVGYQRSFKEIGLDFQTLAPILGFAHIPMNDLGYLRDSIVLVDGTLVLPNVEKSKEAVEKLNGRRLFRLDHGVAHSSHNLMKLSLGYGIEHNQKDCLHFQKLFSLGMKKAPFYFEGGNHFIVSHPKLRERRICLFGKEGFYLALLQLRLLEFFENNSFQTKEEFRAAKLKLKKKMSDTQINENIIEMKNFALIVTEQKAVQVKNEKTRGIAAKYQAQKETLKRVIGIVFSLWPENFMKKTPFNDLPGDDVILVPQIAYHLDLFIHPGPNKSIFLQNFDLCLLWLKGIKKKASNHKFNEEDNRCLKLLLAGAEELSNDLKTFSQMIQKVLKRAGFELIDFPGLFYPPTGQISLENSGVVFTNGLSGYSEKTKRNFFVVAGTSVGPKLGQVLMNKFQLFFKKYNTDVFFVGRNPKDTTDFSSVRSLWKCQAGIHCLTMEE